MIDFAVVIVSDFENQRIEPASDPANGTILLRNVAALVEVIWRSEELLGFFEADRGCGFARSRRLFRGSKRNRTCRPS